ncbi:MAG: N-6 DNA methylase [Bacteroidales bacterium]|nr:N-6 DNA methylase [Bacteroidales bacterium]MCK9498404.1 N-6 DNA methylase [Bacteroidales bacterium]MDY0314404.1 N-6 DNA methylase [Bacteroidales bacterium]NLB86578.1 N-6 DNA methylase [Bacteroidales bacterium]
MKFANSEYSKNDGIKISQVAKLANVSIATIHNWVKTGYLIKIGGGIISKKSFDKFMKEVAGKEKLNSRSNKLLKDYHNQDKISEKLKAIIKDNKFTNIGSEYEKLLSNSYRNKEGIYYTPERIIIDMFKNIEILPDFSFLDPCCGSGNFIIQAIKHGVKPENVYGYDIDKNAVTITKERIKQEFGYDSPNILCCNFLEKAQQLKNQGVNFDLIFTNPPWGKKIEKQEKQKYSQLYKCGNSIDTTSLFLAASLEILNNGGKLAFLIQDAFFNIGQFEDIRRKVVEKNILRFIDYGKAFNGLMTSAKAIVIENKTSSKKDEIICDCNNKSHKRNLKSFVNNPKFIFNFCVNKEENKIIDHLYSINHISLKSNADWALGIVTGNNKKFCINQKKAGYLPIYKGSDITKSGLKKASTFILNDFSKFQQVAPIDYFLVKEKIIYKFISSDLCFYYDKNQVLILNSSNLLIPKNLDISAQQLCELLNSEIINWLFKKIFSTHKILRRDLESLPIHNEYFLKYEKFSEENYLKFLQLEKDENLSYKIINYP